MYSYYDAVKYCYRDCTLCSSPTWTCSKSMSCCIPRMCCTSFFLVSVSMLACLKQCTDSDTKVVNWVCKEGLWNLGCFGCLIVEKTGKNSFIHLDSCCGLSPLKGWILADQWFDPSRASSTVQTVSTAFSLPCYSLPRCGSPPSAPLSHRLENRKTDEGWACRLTLWC